MENSGVKLAVDMGDYVNSFSREKAKDFIQGFIRQHNTLQQSSFRMILELIEFMASDEYRVDGRNEASKNVANKLIKGFETEFHKELAAQGVEKDRLAGYIGENYKPSKFLPMI